MRTSTKQIIFYIGLTFCGSAFALDTSQHEKTCSEIGFKKKSEAHANCVLELLSRQGVVQSTANSSTSNSPDDATCKSYGFKPGTNAYGECRQKIDFAKQEAVQRQRDYEEQKRQYDAAVQARKDRALGAALMSMGQGLTGQNNRSAVAAPPPPPPPSSQMITIPDGRRVTCTTMGSSTQCF